MSIFINKRGNIMQSFSLPFELNLFSLTEDEIKSFKKDLETIHAEENVSLSKDDFIKIIFDFINVTLLCANSINDDVVMHKNLMVLLVDVCGMQYNLMRWKEDERDRVMKVIARLKVYKKIEKSFECALFLYEHNCNQIGEQALVKGNAVAELIRNTLRQMAEQSIKNPNSIVSSAQVISAAQDDKQKQVEASSSAKSNLDTVQPSQGPLRSSDQESKSTSQDRNHEILRNDKDQTQISLTSFTDLTKSIANQGALEKERGNPFRLFESVPAGALSTEFADTVVLQQQEGMSSSQAVSNKRTS